MKIAFYAFMYMAVMSWGTGFGLPVTLKWTISTVLLVLFIMSIMNKDK